MQKMILFGTVEKFFLENKPEIGPLKGHLATLPVWLSLWHLFIHLATLLGYFYCRPDEWSGQPGSEAEPPAHQQSWGQQSRDIYIF